jgi:hypothetical protein
MAEVYDNPKNENEKPEPLKSGGAVRLATPYGHASAKVLKVGKVPAGATGPLLDIEAEINGKPLKITASPHDASGTLPDSWSLPG